VVLDKNLATEAIAAILREFGRRAGTGATLQMSCHDAPPRITVSCATLILSPEVSARFWAPLDADGVLNRGLEGAGLGMSLAQRIMALHNGTIHVDSNVVDGTSVRLDFGAE
jgi:signal transduction histidine kinase